MGELWKTIGIIVTAEMENYDPKVRMIGRMIMENIFFSISNSLGSYSGKQ